MDTKGFKLFMKEKHNTDLDFRTHVYYKNNVGLNPQYSWRVAAKVVKGLKQYVKANNGHLKGLCTQYMHLDELKTTRLEDYISYYLATEK